MLSIKQKYSVSQDHKVSIQLPKTIEPGEHEIIVIVDQPLAYTRDKETDLMVFSATLDWPVDGLEYQRQIRDEWE